MLTGLCAGADTLYNERSYDGRQGGEGFDDDNGRGWYALSLSLCAPCVCNNVHHSIATTLTQVHHRVCFKRRELLSRLTPYPKLRAVLETLPPKQIRISSDAPAEGVDSGVSALDTRVDDVVARILHSSITSGSDREKVPRMYKDYVTRIADMLQKTLAFAVSEHPGIRSRPLQLVLPPTPSVSAPPAEPLRVAVGQPLLSCGAKARRNRLRRNCSWGSSARGSTWPSP